MVRQNFREVRLVWTNWHRWRTRHPETRVLSEDSGFDRDYGTDHFGQYNPTTGCYASDRTPYPWLNRDDRYKAKGVMFDARTPYGATTVLKDVVRDQKLVSGAIDGWPFLWVFDRRVDTAFAYWNPDRLEYREFMGVYQGPEGNYEADELPPERSLEVEAMRFAWSGLYPETTVHGWGAARPRGPLSN